MAVTTPDNLYSPDGTSPYNFTVDAAAMQASVQAALTARPRNYRTDLTNAQRIALTGADLFEGLRVWTTDTKIEWLYTGSAWVSVEGDGNIVRPTSIVGGTQQADGSINFSAVATVSLNGIFTSRFREYEVRYRTTTKTLSAGISIRLRNAGTDNSTGNYFYRRIGNAGGTAVAEFGQTAGTSFEPDFTATPVIVKSLRLLTPNTATPTVVWSAGGIETDNSINITNTLSFSGVHKTSTAFDGLTLYVAAGTMTGNLVVVGYP